MDIEEEMVGLYHTIDSILEAKEKKLVQFVGSVDGEGVSSLTREFARISATVFGKSVLLVNGGESRVSESIGNEQTDRFKELITQRTPLNHFIDRKEHNAYFTGDLSKLGASLSVIFSSPHLTEFVGMLKEKFDIIVFDSPPATSSPDALAVARKVDGVVLVVEAESTRWPVVDNVRDKIQKVGGNILGVILNKQKRYIPPSIYKRL